MRKIVCVLNMAGHLLNHTHTYYYSSVSWMPTSFVELCPSVGCLLCLWSRSRSRSRSNIDTTKSNNTSTSFLLGKCRLLYFLLTSILFHWFILRIVLIMMPFYAVLRYSSFQSNKNMLFVDQSGQETRLNCVQHNKANNGLHL